MSKQESDLLEKLSEAEHAGWASWMDYLFGKCSPNPDGSMTIPAALVDRWMTQVRTPFAQLSEAEKEADRREVLKILPIIRDYYQT